MPGHILIWGALALALSADTYRPVHEYDPKRDASKDIREAVAEAGRSGRRVLVEVGGKWCGWCRRLDKVFADNPDLTALRDKNYVLLKVNFSPENENKTALSKYPKIDGYPHIFVLDSNGGLLHCQNTGELEEGKGYNLAKIKAFLEKWAPR
jgi:thiol:disulfide interchange protein